MKQFKITYALIFISVIVSLVSCLGTNTTLINFLFFSNHTSGMSEIFHGQVWRLITPIFIHFGLIHILFNSIATWQLGKIMEHMYPSLTYICIITGISAVSNFTQFVFVGPNFGGLSGLLYGLFGYLWIYGWKNPNAVFKLTQATVIIFLIWYILCWTGLLGNIANWAHTGGLLTGMLLGFIAASTYTAKNSKFDTFNNIDL